MYKEKRIIGFGWLFKMLLFIVAIIIFLYFTNMERFEQKIPAIAEYRNIINSKLGNKFRVRRLLNARIRSEQAVLELHSLDSRPLIMLAWNVESGEKSSQALQHLSKLKEHFGDRVHMLAINVTEGESFLEIKQFYAEHGISNLVAYKDVNSFTSVNALRLKKQKQSVESVESVSKPVSVQQSLEQLAEEPSSQEKQASKQAELVLEKTWKIGSIPTIYFANKDKVLIYSTVDVFKKSAEEVEEILFNGIDWSEKAKF